MTPRQSDIAFVLESVPGVVALYALQDVRRVTGELDLAVQLKQGRGHFAAAHYALLRVMSHDECRRVLFFESVLPPRIAMSAMPIELTSMEREAARGRVPEVFPILTDPPRPMRRRGGGDEPFAALVVDADLDVYRAVVAAVGVAARRVQEPDPERALARALAEDFDIVLCDARVAFGHDGFLRTFYDADPVGAEAVVVIANDGTRDHLAATMNDLAYCNSYLSRPVDADMLRHILFTGCIVQHWTIPVPRPRAAPAHPAPTREVPRRVLVIDDDPDTAILLDTMRSGVVRVTVTTDEWEALDQLSRECPDLVLCSVSMRTLGGAPFYRFLWNARPDLKQRFVFIARHEALSPSNAGRAAGERAVERPITRDVVTTLVERFAPG